MIRSAHDHVVTLILSKISTLRLVRIISADTRNVPQIFSIPPMFRTGTSKTREPPTTKERKSNSLPLLTRRVVPECQPVVPLLHLAAYHRISDREQPDNDPNRLLRSYVEHSFRPRPLVIRVFSPPTSECSRMTVCRTDSYTCACLESILLVQSSDQAYSVNRPHSSETVQSCAIQSAVDRNQYLKLPANT